MRGSSHGEWGTLQSPKRELSHCCYQELPVTGPAGPFACISSHLVTTAGSALAPRAPLRCSAQAGHEYMSTWSSFSQVTAGHSPEPLSSAATTSSVPAQPQAMSCTQALQHRALSPWEWQDAGKGLTRSPCCSYKALLAPGGTTALPSLEQQHS